jgi:phenylalanine-4-hydroxylase
MAFTAEQHETWSILYDCLLPRIQKHACAEYLRGFELLALPAAAIPSVEFLNERITPATGWKTVRTTVRYSDAVDWYNEFDRKHFLVTDYMRERQELDFTPEPDMFHDIFGHLPFMMLPEYAELEEMFAPAFLRAGEEQRENIKRLAWYSTEFGLIRENGEVKLFGAGLISSAAECDRVISGEVPILPFKCTDIIQHAKSVWDFNAQLFIAESLDDYKQELASYFDTVG